MMVVCLFGRLLTDAGATIAHKQMGWVAGETKIGVLNK